MRVIYEKQALKMLARMPAKIRAAFQEKIAAFAANPRDVHVDVKPLQGTKASYRLRHGSWRAILVMMPGSVTVETIGARGDVYK
jgi:mRNA-degrading endonuclease RelE of RelBE toxin-antitoxin system